MSSDTVMEEADALQGPSPKELGTKGVDSEIGFDDESLQIEPEELRLLIAEYLIHECYPETAQFFLEGNDSMTNSFAAANDSIPQRKKLANLVISGKISEAIELTNKLFPNLLTNNLEVSFKLQSQVYIELLRQKMTKEALIFAQEQLAPFGKLDPKFFDLLQDIIALIAYDSPETSPLGQYMTDSYRENVADALNNTILRSLGMPESSRLALLMKQLTAVQDQLYQEESKKGPRWRLSDIVNSGSGTNLES